MFQEVKNIHKIPRETIGWLSFKQNITRLEIRNISIAEKHFSIAIDFHLGTKYSIKRV